MTGWCRVWSGTTPMRLIADGSSPPSSSRASAHLPATHTKKRTSCPPQPRRAGHNPEGKYPEARDEYRAVDDRLAPKHAAAAKYLPEPLVERRHGARIGVVTVGGCDLAVREALEILEERGTVADFMRIR